MHLLLPLSLIIILLSSASILSLHFDHQQKHLFSRWLWGYHRWLFGARFNDRSKLLIYSYAAVIAGLLLLALWAAKQ